MISRKGLRIGISEAPRLGLVAAALARHHIGRDRPRAAREAEQSRFGGQARFHFLHSPIDRLQPRRRALQRGQRGIDQRRRKPRPFARLEAQVLAERVRHDQDVGEQDRAVEAEAADRLEGDLGRGLGIVDELEEAALLGPQLRDIRAGSARPGASARSE